VCMCVCVCAHVRACKNEAPSTCGRHCRLRNKQKAVHLQQLPLQHPRGKVLTQITTKQPAPAVTAVSYSKKRAKRTQHHPPPAAVAAMALRNTLRKHISFPPHEVVLLHYSHSSPNPTPSLLPPSLLRVARFEDSFCGSWIFRSL